MHPHVGVIHLAGMNGGPDIGILVLGGYHQLLDGTPELFGGTVVPAGQLADGAVNVRLAPEDTGAVVEDVEVARHSPPAG